MQHRPALSNMAAALPGRCGFFLEKKKRFCKMIVSRGRRFCGEHATMEEGSSRRIVCPLDPKHTVSEDKLDKHLKKCNSREKPRPVYYVENINSGPADGDDTLQQVSLSEQSRTQLESLLDKLKTAATGLQCDEEDRVLSHPALQEELNNPKNGDSAHKHLKQQVDGKHHGVGVEFERLQVDIQHLDLSKVPLLTQKKLPLVGVGKHLCGAATDLALRCLLETPGLRQETGPPRKRLKTSEPAGPESAVPAALPGPGPDPDPRLHPGPVQGLAVALCCHHRCEWRHYVGQKFFLQRGLGAEEFSAFCRMSSWATCGLRPTTQDPPPRDPTSQRGDEEEHEPAEETDAVNGFLSAAEREQVGRLCKRLIDGGRIHFLQTRGFDSRLSRYVNSRVTPENVLLTAVPSSSSSSC
ncbi:tRNA:m(4)X modification enzyme TRM13 homolog isoform X2 [Acanthopagrus latus]|uniref:tRNA:m(4)X modification enzyme TRM13 homolog isoform X2 n=1 Tax=Acanthopagrus latus TaxID=8177 RepID=UPI00187D06E4|nr:tRNA:m(4)X modification enzyme TRM13 homolog isoform X2 [Acanthopagrus latus]